MKSSVGFLVFALALLANSMSAAQLIVNFDENGNGTFAGSPMPFRLNFLRYQFPINITVGDVLITEGPPGPNGTPNSDLLRFDDNGGVTVFSELEAGETNSDLADVPAAEFPTVQPGTPTFAETDPSGGPAVEGGINGLFGYAPTASQPGGNPNGPPIIYNFTSDEVPEPGSLLLVAGVIVMIRRSGHRSITIRP